MVSRRPNSKDTLSDTNSNIRFSLILIKISQELIFANHQLWKISQELIFANRHFRGSKSDNFQPKFYLLQKCLKVVVFDKKASNYSIAFFPYNLCTHIDNPHKQKSGPDKN